MRLLKTPNLFLIKLLINSQIPIFTRLGKAAFQIFWSKTLKKNSVSCQAFLRTALATPGLFNEHIFTESAARPIQS